MVQRWDQHVQGWCWPQRDGVFYISYEDLSRDFDGSLVLIGEFLEMQMPEAAIVPPLRGVHPWRGEIGNWRNYFTGRDEEFFLEHGTEAMLLAGS